MSRLMLSAVLCFSTVLSVDAIARPGTSLEDHPQQQFLIGTPGSVLHSSGTADGLVARETAGPDTFALYGGPDHPTEGKFQLADGVTADWGSGNGLPGGYGGGTDAWTPVDLTYQRVYWHPDTFNAENLNTNGPGNHAMWCGLPAGDPDTAGWANSQGYGNYWSDGLIYVSDPVPDESVGQTVSLEFFLNYDTELDWDFVYVEYLRSGIWVEVASAMGTNADGSGAFAAPGVRFSDIQTAPIEYFGNDYAYGGLVSGGIVIRIRFESDVAYSDEDGLFVSSAGAVQVDDITLSHSLGTFFEDFEGAGPYLFYPEQLPFFGDFADVYPRFSDIDPCRENGTPVVGFIDYNQIVRNGPGASGAVQTGGEPNQGVAYGIPGSWATNHSGGLDHLGTIDNMIVSPEIPIDLPGPGDDDPAFAGFTLRFDAWEHGGDNSYGEGEIWYSWAVRSALPGQEWGAWDGDPFFWGVFATGNWVSRVFDLSSYVEPGAEKIQVMIKVIDSCEFSFGCDPNSAPAPVFDNVAVYKYRLPGPVLSTRMTDQAQDGFPVNGSIDTSTAVSRDALDVPFSMGRDLNDQGMLNVPGDSITVDVTPTIPGTEISDLRLVWALQTNPLFEDALRSAPSRPVDESVVSGAAGTIWSGEVVADTARTSSGNIVAGRFFADLPDLDFMYPGDVLHYYFKATDTDGRVSTLPYDVSSLGVFGPGSTFDRRFIVRALPSLEDAAGTQPSLLVIDESGELGDAPEIHSSLQQLGYAEGAGYDTYTVRSPGSTMGNGIGSAGAHGASAAQLAGYEHVFYLAGQLSFGLLSDGNSQFDKGDDVGVLEDWHALPGTRNTAYFGDEIASAHAGYSEATAAYLVGTMGVDWLGEDVREAIGGQTAPVVYANPAWSPDFMVSYAAYGGCESISTFDQIQPLAGATAGHHFASVDGTAITDPSAGVASVVHSTGNGLDITFPFALSAIQSLQARATGPSARTALIAEVLALFGSSGGSPAVDAPSVREVNLSVSPNPLNPMTVVRFSGVIGRRGSVRVYNLQGGLVRTLHSGEFIQTEFRWDGSDSRGANVASGVYLVRAAADDVVKTAKVALVR